MDINYTDDEDTHIFDGVDYVTLVSPQPQDIYSYDEMKKLAENLKFISKDLQIPVVSATQKEK